MGATPTTIQFRPLHENEAHLLTKMVESGEAGKGVIAASLADSEFEILVAYRYQEHREHEKYTIALVMIKGDEKAMMLTGVSKHNKADPPNPILGRVKALRRAFASEVVFDLGSLPGYEGVEGVIGEIEAVILPTPTTA